MFRRATRTAIESSDFLAKTIPGVILLMGLASSIEIVRITPPAQKKEFLSAILFQQLKNIGLSAEFSFVIILLLLVVVSLVLGELIDTLTKTSVPSSFRNIIYNELPDDRYLSTFVRWRLRNQERQVIGWFLRVDTDKYRIGSIYSRSGESLIWELMRRHDWDCQNEVTPTDMYELVLSDVQPDTKPRLSELKRQYTLARNLFVSLVTTAVFLILAITYSIWFPIYSSINILALSLAEFVLLAFLLLVTLFIVMMLASYLYPFLFAVENARINYVHSLVTEHYNMYS